MATQHSRSAARFMMAPAVILLLGWMLVPLTMTLFFSFKKFLPLRGDSLANGLEWVGFANYVRFVGSSSFWPSIQATLIIVGGVLVGSGVVFMLLGLLRLLQTELSGISAADSRLSWLPYLIVLVIGVGVLVVTLQRISRTELFSDREQERVSK